MVAPVEREAEAGLMVTEASVGAGAGVVSAGAGAAGTVMLTTAVSAKVEEVLVATTRYLPPDSPAVKTPPASMVPPVADQVTPTGTVVPSAWIPTAVKVWVPSARSATESGVVFTATRSVVELTTVTVELSVLMRPRPRPTTL